MLDSRLGAHRRGEPGSGCSPSALLLFFLFFVYGPIRGKPSHTRARATLTFPASMRWAQRASQMMSMNHMPTKLMVYICEWSWTGGELRGEGEKGDFQQTSKIWFRFFNYRLSHHEATRALRVMRRIPIEYAP